MSKREQVENWVDNSTEAQALKEDIINRLDKTFNDANTNMQTKMAVTMLVFKLAGMLNGLKLGAKEANVQMATLVEIAISLANGVEKITALMPEDIRPESVSTDNPLN